MTTSYRARGNAVLTPGGFAIIQDAEQLLGLKANQCLLSVACGVGEVELYLAAKYGCRVTGIDITPHFIAEASRQSDVHGLVDQADFHVGDANALEFPDAAFDVVLCVGALFTFLERGLPEISRVLKPGGQLVVVDLVWRRPNVPKPTVLAWTTGHGCIFTLSDYAVIFRNHGYEVLHQKAYNEPEWWANFYRARINGAKDNSAADVWVEQHTRYRCDMNYLGLGLLMLRYRHTR